MQKEILYKVFIPQVLESNKCFCYHISIRVRNAHYHHHRCDQSHSLLYHLLRLRHFPRPLTCSYTYHH